jgi:hypothetical protein
MADSNSNGQGFLIRHEFKIQTLGFVSILALPFFLYLAAQAQLNFLITLLIGLKALVMLALVVVS